MRTLMLIVVSLALLGGGFMLYRWTQPAISQASSASGVGGTERTTMSDEEARLGVIRTGAGAWATKFDRDTGRTMVRFRATEFQPQPDGRIIVKNPQAEFFVGPQRQHICRIEGNSGWVSLRGDAPRVKRDLSAAGPMQTPTRGDMQGVRIRYYESLADMEAGRDQVRLDLEHMSFDIETFRIATEAYVDAQGKRVEADEVPVQVRGDAFDFDGKGLQLRWDDTDQKLQMLRVAKGGRLLVKKPGALELPGRTPAATTNESAARPFDRRLDGDLLAAAARRPAAVRPVATRRASTDVYRATFHSNVKMTQGQQQLAQTPEMHVDFLSPNSKAATRATPATAAASPAPATRKAATRPAGGTAAPATSEPAEEPVLITWDGDFTVYPAPEDAIRPTTANDAVVRLVGSGTTITANGGRIDCDEAVYHVAPKTAMVRGGARVPAKLVDARGAVITSPAMEYSASENWAVLTGPSAASIPTQQAGKTETLAASWTRVCTLRMTAGKHSVLESAELTGDVKVQHPQVPRFAAEKLLLKFDTQAKKAEADGKGAGFDASSAKLRHLEAEGGVDCVLADAASATRSIRCEKLNLDADNGADGKLYPTRLEAHGKVVAGDKEQQIKAENVLASLVPQLRGGKSSEFAGLRDFAADGDVSMSSADGGKLQAEKVTLVGGEDGKPKRVRLEAKPGQMAMLAKADRAIWGNVIEADAVTQQASVPGPGAMRLSNPASGDRPAMPLDVTWKQSAVVDGGKNVADVTGQVAVTFLASDGSTNNAWGESVHLDLAPTPNAKPPREGEVSFLADRFVKHLELRPLPQGEVQVQSLLPAADGSLIRQMNLLGPVLICDLSPAGLEQLTVPAGKEKPGRMLYLDLTPANRKAAAVKPSLESQGLHGATAFAWNDKLTYDRAKAQVEMTGSVLIRHEPSDRSAESFEVTADRVLALLAEQRDVGGRVPAAPKVKPESQTPTVALKQITIEGAPLRFKREDIEFSAPRLDFEPITHMAVAKADRKFPVHVDKGVSRGDFGEVELNTETQMVKLRDAGLTGRK